MHCTFHGLLLEKVTKNHGNVPANLLTLTLRRDISTTGPVANFYHSITHPSKQAHGAPALAGCSVEPKQDAVFRGSNSDCSLTALRLLS